MAGNQRKVCPICSRVEGNLKLGSNQLWECSHVLCPNRNKVTAQPSDGLSLDNQFNLTSHHSIKEDR